MACRIVEVEQEVLEILHGFPPDKGIDHRPDDERSQDAHRPAAEEFPGRIVKRELQIAGGHHEKGHAGTGQYIQDGHPDGIGSGEDEGAFSAQIKRFVAVRHHDEEAGHDAQRVDPDFSLSFHNSITPAEGTPWKRPSNRRTDVNVIIFNGPSKSFGRSAGGECD